MKKYGTLIFGIIGWVIAIIIFFPIFWMTITAFKTERGAYSPDLIFMPTLESFKDVFARSNYLAFVMNSIYVSIGSTLVCFLFAIPAAYKMSFFPTLKTQGRLLWMLSTKMMPAVGVLVPIYLLFKQFGSVRQHLRIDHHLHPDESSDRRLDVLHLLLRNSSGDSGSGPDRRGNPLARDLAPFASDDLTRPFIDRR